MKIRLYEDLSSCNALCLSGGSDFCIEKNIESRGITLNLSDEYFEKYFKSEHEFFELRSKCQSEIQNHGLTVKSKRLLVVLHGWGVSSDLYSNLAANLCENSRVLTFDFWGFGNNCEITETKNITDYAMQLARLLCLFEFDELVVVAHSFGARVFFHALKIFLHTHEYGNCFCFLSCFQKLFKNGFFKLRRVLLTGAAGEKQRFNLKTYLKIYKYKKLKKKCKNNPKLTKKLLKYGSNDYKNIKNQFLKKTFVSVVNSHTFDNLSNVDMKIINGFLKMKFLLIFGERDKQTPLYMAKKMKKKLLHSNLVIIRKSSHFCFLERSEEFLNLCKNIFLA